MRSFKCPLDRLNLFLVALDSNHHICKPEFIFQLRDYFEIVVLDIDPVRARNIEKFAKSLMEDFEKRTVKGNLTAPEAKKFDLNKNPKPKWYELFAEEMKLDPLSIHVSFSYPIDNDRWQSQTKTPSADIDVYTGEVLATVRGMKRAES